MRSRLIAAALSIAALPASGALAQTFAPDTHGRIDFRSGPPGAETAAIWGYLFLPPGTARAPAMVLMHGSSGLNAGSRVHYSELLNRHGIAAFYVDSFAGRGISSTVRNQAVLSYVDNTRDAFVALRLLRRHPRFDPVRIGVMGFSRGGTISWRTAMRDSYIPFRGEGLRFALHVPFYPGCNFGTAAATTGAPMLFLLGGADTWVRADHCVDFIRYLQRTNPRIDFKVFPGAHHAWDSPAQDGRLIAIRDAQNVTGCDTVLTNLDGSGLDPKTGRHLTRPERNRAFAACRRSSTVYVQANRAIRAQSDADLIAFLQRHFGR